jgi:hypothetical protein
VLCTRKTDAIVSALDGTVGADISTRTLEISTDFSTGELDRLPEYLVSLRVAESIEKARAMMLAPGVKQSRDVLCSLWYLLPQTQGSIEESRIGEYQRLGETEKVVAAFATAVGASKSVAKAAYELVTTTSGFDNVALPVEVLVSALGISYPEWSESCSDNKPLWGLLYDEEYPSAESYAYRLATQANSDV